VGQKHNNVNVSIISVSTINQHNDILDITLPIIPILHVRIINNCKTKNHDHTDNSLGLMQNNTQLTFSDQVMLGKRFPLRTNK